jgi:hypothetical protein
VVVHAKSSWLLSGLQVIGKRDFPLPIRMPLFIFFFFCEYYANTLGFLELACDLLVLVFSIEPDV